MTSEAWEKLVHWWYLSQGRAFAEYPAKLNAPGVFGYGGNNWMAWDFERLADLMVANGVRVFHPLVLGWPPTDHYANYSAATAALGKAIKTMRRRRILTFVEIANDNKGKGKYGDDKKGLDVYQDALRHVVNWFCFKGVGPTGVVIQPVGEGGSNTGAALQGACKVHLHDKRGYSLCDNWGSRPGYASEGYDYFAWHPEDENQRLPAGAVNVCDHSDLLRYLCQNRDFYRKFDEARLERYARQQRERGHAFVAYAFGPELGIDEGALRALGRART